MNSARSINFKVNGGLSERSSFYDANTSGSFYSGLLHMSMEKTPYDDGELSGVSNAEAKQIDKPKKQKVRKKKKPGLKR